MTILATPSILPAVERDGDYVRALLGRLCPPDVFKAEQRTIDVLLAGVNQIALPSRLTAPHASPAGCSGLSFRLSGLATTVTDPGRQSAETKPYVYGSPEGKLYVSLAMHPLPGPHSAPAAAPRLTHTVALRLAHTLFTNGRPHTLRLQHWTPSPDTAQWAPSTETALATACVSVGSLRPSPTFACAAAALRPLTPPRPVADCFGNVLRTFAGPAGGEPVPASEELERAVTALLASPPAPGATLDVWAAVTRRGYADPPPDPAAQLGLTYSGDPRLYRVAGGGGGWGAKRGLISLETDAESAAPGAAWDGAGGPFALEPVAREGDRVSFLGLWAPASAERRPLDRSLAGRHMGGRVRFGSAGAAVAGTGVADRTHAEPVLVTGHFGALSERTASLRVLRETGTGPPEEMSRTAVPPFCSFEWQQSSSGQPETTGEVGVEKARLATNTS